jgi:aminocarboxymuconate-semialdehyde decarboxylase
LRRALSRLAVFFAGRSQGFAMPTAHAAIDVHTHILPPGWEDYGARFGVGDWPSLMMHDACSATIMLGAREFRKITEQTFAPARRIADMNATRIGRQLISPVPIMMCYWGPAEATAAFARMQNDFIAQCVERHPDSFLAAGTVALQSPRHAIAEIERLHKLGFPAIEIGTKVNGRDLDDSMFFEALAACESLGMAIFVHPQEPTIGAERMQDYQLPFLVGYTADTALALTRVLLSGVLERLPKLRLCFAHSGGNFPSALGRLEKGYASIPAVRKNISRPPREYAQRLWFDTITHDPQYLQLNVERFGSHRIVIGSDYPFAMGVERPLEQLDGLKLTAEDVENITFRAAAAFLNLPKG